MNTTPSNPAPIGAVAPQETSDSGSSHGEPVSLPQFTIYGPGIDHLPAGTLDELFDEGRD